MDISIFLHPLAPLCCVIEGLYYFCLSPWRRENLAAAGGIIVSIVKFFHGKVIRHSLNPKFDFTLRPVPIIYLAIERKKVKKKTGILETCFVSF